MDRRSGDALSRRSAVASQSSQSSLSRPKAAAAIARETCSAPDFEELARRLETYSPKLSMDNLADEMPLDLEIAKAFDRSPQDAFVARGSVTGYMCGDGKGGFGTPTIERYTRSIDAALKLIDDTCVWGVSRQEYNPGCDYYYQASVMPFGPMPWGEAKAANPALAICAAALRAKMAK